MSVLALIAVSIIVGISNPFLANEPHCPVLFMACRVYTMPQGLRMQCCEHTVPHLYSCQPVVMCAQAKACGGLWDALR